PHARAALGVLLVAAASLIVACGGATATVACHLVRGASAAPGGGSASWPYPNADLANTRDATDSTISSANVSTLRQAWTFKLTGRAAAGVRPYGSLTASPIVQDGRVYIQDLDSNVYALALATGRLQWEYRCDQPERSGPGPNGVAVAGGRVYGLTPTGAFALNAATGSTIWFKRGLLDQGQGSFGIQPQVAGGRVYLASQYGSGPGGGVLLALNASSGGVLWRFDTVVGPDPGVRSLGLGAGGAWETPLVGDDGSVTYGIGNPYQTPDAAIAHPAIELYTDSDVDLNATTGKLIWKAPVGLHNGHDTDSLEALEHRGTALKAPLTILPGSLGGVLADPAVADGSVYVGMLDLAITYPTLKLPVATTAAGPLSGEVEALTASRPAGSSRDTNVAQMPLGAATVSNDLVFTTLYDGELIALNRRTGAIAATAQRPFHSGSRFSKNARTPSWMSSVENAIVSCERRKSI
ncbi:MAG: PQQ-binding-like beta-propeller repeat protein, partial [Candidatus Dormibacteraceae bacterium]